MNEATQAVPSQVSAVSASADVMLKRVFNAAKILATAKSRRGSEAEDAENSVEKHRGDKLRYRGDGRSKQPE